MNADLPPVGKEDRVEGLRRKVELLREGEAARGVLGRLRNEDLKVRLEGPRAELCKIPTSFRSLAPAGEFQGPADPL